MPENIITRAPEIVAALREEAERQPNISLYHNAADLIEQLAAEVERLQDPCGYIALKMCIRDRSKGNIKILRSKF